MTFTVSCYALQSKIDSPSAPGLLNIACQEIISVPQIKLLADDTGVLVRTGSGEDIDAGAEIEKTEVRGWGHRKVKKAVRYRGNEFWEAA